jgi:microcystin-dependent protein
MTVTTTANSISYAGNGVTTSYSFPYIFFAPTDLVVTLFDVAANAYINPPPVLNGPAANDYTVTGVVTDGEYASGGSVTFNTAPITGWTVSLVRIVPAIQTVTLIDNTKFPAATINTEFDYLTVLAQQSITTAPPVAGPLTGVVAGIGLSGGGTSGIVTLNLKPDAPGVVPIGGIVDFAGSVAPANWLLCQGQSLATAGTYGVLFTTIGYTYGGSGANFNLPDLRGRVTAGKEATPTRLTTAGSGIDGSVLGAVGGNQNMGQHAHVITTHRHQGLYGGNTVANASAANVYGYLTTAGTGNAVSNSNETGDSSTTPNTGTFGAGASGNVQPTLIMNKIIRFA